MLFNIYHHTDAYTDTACSERSELEKCWKKLRSCTFQGAVENPILLQYYTSRYLRWAARPGILWHRRGVLLHRSNTTIQKEGSCKVPAPSISQELLQCKGTFWKPPLTVVSILFSPVQKPFFFLLKLHLFLSVHLWLFPLCLTQFTSLNIKQLLADTVSDMYHPTALNLNI